MSKKPTDDSSTPDTAIAKSGEPEAAALGPEVLKQPPGEIGGPKGPEPTRYGDWAHKGIVSDF